MQFSNITTKSPLYIVPGRVEPMLFLTFHIKLWKGGINDLTACNEIMYIFFHFLLSMRLKKIKIHTLSYAPFFVPITSAKCSLTKNKLVYPITQNVHFFEMSCYTFTWYFLKRAIQDFFSTSLFPRYICGMTWTSL